MEASIEMKYESHPKSLDLLLDDAMITIESRPLDSESQTATESTSGEKPQARQRAPEVSIDQEGPEKDNYS